MPPPAIRLRVVPAPRPPSAKGVPLCAEGKEQRGRAGRGAFARAEFESQGQA